MNIEIIVQAFSGSMIGFNGGMTMLSLVGYTSLWVFLIGGICGVIIGSLNDYPKFYNIKIWKQMLIGGTIIILFELLFGIFLNLILGLKLWEYIGVFQFMGQIELKNSILWYGLSLVIIWLDDTLTYYLYNEGKLYSFWSMLKKLMKRE